MTRKSISIFVFVFITLCFRNLAFSSESVGSYTLFYFKEPGVASATNSDFSGEWTSCEQKTSSCLTKLPADLNTSKVKTLCLTNSGVQNTYPLFSNADLLSLMVEGESSLELANWVTTLCGYAPDQKDAVGVHIYESSTEKESWKDETLALFQSKIRNWYLFTVRPDPVEARLEIASTTVKISFLVSTPPQGSGMTIVPRFVPKPFTIAKRDDWTNFDSMSYCELPESLSSTDTLVGTDISFDLEIPYEDYAELTGVVQEGSFDLSAFRVELDMMTCSPEIPREDVQKRYIANGAVRYDRRVSAISSFKTSTIDSEVEEQGESHRMSSELKFCTDETCVATHDLGVGTLTINESKFLVLEIPDSSRTYETNNLTLVDFDGYPLTGAIEMVIHDASQAGRVIYKMTVLEVTNLAVLRVFATSTQEVPQQQQRRVRMLAAAADDDGTEDDYESATSNIVLAVSDQSSATAVQLSSMSLTAVFVLFAILNPFFMLF